MNKNQTSLAVLRRKQNRKLRSGRAKSLGPVESISMKICGRIDASRGLPAKKDAEGWSSPLMCKESHRFEEFTARSWGDLALAAADSYISLANLTDSLSICEKEREKLAAEIAGNKGKTIPLNQRKHGEEVLTDSQVQARRQREEARRHAPLAAKLQALEQRIRNEAQALTALRNEIAEAENVTGLVCDRVAKHSQQRMDVYWNAAYAKHPENAKMPAVPDFTIRDIACEAYRMQHAPLMQRATELLDRLGNLNKEEEKEVA